MDDGLDSGYPSPRDGLPNTSTPNRPGRKPSLKEHFLGVDTTIGFGNDGPQETSSTDIPKSKPSHTKADEGIRDAIKAEREVVERKKLDRSRNEENHNLIQHLEFDLVGARKSNEKACAEIKKRDEQIEQLQKEATEWQKQIDFQAELNEQLKTRCTNLENERNNIRALIQTYENERAQLKVQLKEVENSRTELQEETKRLLAKNTELEQHIVTIRQATAADSKTCTSLEKENDELKSVLKQKIEIHTVDLDRIEQLQTERGNLEKELGILKEKQTAFLHAENCLREELATLREQNDKLVLKNSRLNDCNGSIQGELAELQQNYAALTQRCEIVEAENKSYAVKISNMDSERKEREKVQKQLSEYQTKTAQLEAQMAQLVSDNSKISTEMLDVKQKNNELESVNEHYAHKEVETSANILTLQREVSIKQKECQQLSEELSVTRQRLEENDDKIKRLNEAIAKDSQSKKACAELEKLNLQLTNEIEYLRSKTKEQPSHEEYRAVKEKVDLAGIELGLKEQQLQTMEEKVAELNQLLSTSKNAQLEFEKVSTIIKEQEAQIDLLTRSKERIQEELNEKNEVTAKLIEEFERFKDNKEEEIKQYAVKLGEAEENYVRTHGQLQREVKLRSFSSAACGSSVWESIPEEIRLQLPQNTEEILQSLKIGPARNIYSVDQENSQFLHKLAELIDKYSLENLSSSDVTYNILKMASRLLRLHTDNLNSFVASFSAEVSQFVESRERKQMARISELEQMKIEESKGRREYHVKAHDLEHELDVAKVTNTGLQNQIASLKAEVFTKTNLIETRENVIVTLKNEIEELKDVHSQLQQQLARNEEAASGFHQMIAEYESEKDQLHAEELRLHERIRFAESEAELLKREKTGLETDCQTLSLENETITRKLQGVEQKALYSAQELGDYKKRLAHEEKTKRYNQETMRICIEYMDKYKEAIEHLKQRNWQRQKVLDKIASDIDMVCNQKSLEGYKKLLNEKCPKWKKADDELNSHLKELYLSFQNDIKARSTPELQKAVKDVRQNNIENKSS